MSTQPWSGPSGNISYPVECVSQRYRQKCIKEAGFNWCRCKTCFSLHFKHVLLWNIWNPTRITVHPMVAGMLLLCLNDDPIDTLYVCSILTVIQYLPLKTKENRMVEFLHANAKGAYTPMCLGWLDHRICYSVTCSEVSVGRKMKTSESSPATWAESVVFCCRRKNPTNQQFILWVSKSLKSLLNGKMIASRTSWEENSEIWQLKLKLTIC